MCNQYPDVLALIESKLKTTGDLNSTSFLAAQNMTLTQTLVAFAGKNISAYFVDGLSDILNPIALKLINRDGIMGYHGVPQIPMFAYKAVADEISPIADTDNLITGYCSAGANILYQRNSIGGHSAEQTNGRAAASAWLDSVLGGTYSTTYNTTGCTIQDVAVHITSSPY